VGVAVNIAVVPGQICVPTFDDAVTDGVTEPVTLMVNALLVTVADGLGQAALLVISTVTTSPFTNVVPAFQLAPVAMLLPFFFH
jgi:hypothetical protein